MNNEPTARESLIACLGDDAAKLEAENPGDEMAQTMREAAAMLEAASEQANTESAAAPADRLDEALATFLAEHTRLNQDGVDSHAMKMVLALNYAALNPVPKSAIEEWREQGYIGAAEGGATSAPVYMTGEIGKKKHWREVTADMYERRKRTGHPVRVLYEGDATSERKPLTEGRAFELAAKHGRKEKFDFRIPGTLDSHKVECVVLEASDALSLIRAIEQHHGIGGGKND